MSKQYNLKRQAYSSGDLSAKFTVTQPGHPMLGKAFDFLIFEEVTVKTDAKSGVLKGKGSWPVARTMTMSEDPSCELAGVPAETRFLFVEFINGGSATAKNGPGNTSGTLEITARLPYLDADSVKIFEWKWENCGDLTFKRDGSTENATGNFVSMEINGVDPLSQEG